MGVVIFLPLLILAIVGGLKKAQREAIALKRAAGELP